MAHLLIRSLRERLAPDCLPLFTSDGLNLYFYALTAHFGQWLQVVRRGRKVSQWQVAAELIYGQVKKSYQRRKLVRVTRVMRLGTEAALTAALQGLGFSGRLNTAFIACSLANEGASVWRSATGNELQPWQQAQRTGDGRRRKFSALPCRRSAAQPTESL